MQTFATEGPSLPYRLKTAGESERYVLKHTVFSSVNNVIRGMVLARSGVRCFGQLSSSQHRVMKAPGWALAWLPQLAPEHSGRVSLSRCAALCGAAPYREWRDTECRLIRRSPGVCSPDGALALFWSRGTWAADFVAVGERARADVSADEQDAGWRAKDRRVVC